MSREQSHDDLLGRAAAAIRSAEAILIGAGAGMGVDSGLPDFRGGQGFWKAYPPYAELGLDFVSLANPQLFLDDPALAWGFYGHRLMLYRETTPHEGFAILRRWMSRMPRGGFVYTMFGDWGWDSSHAEAQQRRLKSWLASIAGARLVVIECGAGTAIPTVRRACEEIARRYDATLIRINPRDPEVPHGQISLPMGAFEALRAIDERIGSWIPPTIAGA